MVSLMCGFIFFRVSHCAGRSLLEAGVSESEVAVISPYNGQVRYYGCHRPSFVVSRVLISVLGRNDIGDGGAIFTHGRARLRPGHVYPIISFVWCCVVLCCGVACCVGVCCVVVWCCVVQCGVVCYAVFSDPAVSCRLLSCVVLSCVVLTCLALCCIALRCAMLCCIVLSCVALCCLSSRCASFLALCCVVLSYLALPSLVSSLTLLASACLTRFCFSLPFFAHLCLPFSPSSTPQTATR